MPCPPAKGGRDPKGLSVTLLQESLPLLALAPDPAHSPSSREASLPGSDLEVCSHSALGPSFTSSAITAISGVGTNGCLPYPAAPGAAPQSNGWSAPQSTWNRTLPASLTLSFRQE